MKILIINPNSNEIMTKAILGSALSYANNRFEVVCISNSKAPYLIETYGDEFLSAEGMLNMVLDNSEEYDAFIVACHCDPNLDLLKEATKKPVIGIGEASMKIASMLGHSFSVISSEKHSIPNKEALIRKYHLQDSCASVRSPQNDGCGCMFEEKFVEAAKDALEEDMAEVIVLGCAGMAGLDKNIENRIGATVLDGVVCALMLAEGFVRHNITTSKVRRYNPNY